jgi:threonyl-tRNA synthetase
MKKSTYPLETLRHSTAHILATAIMELYPNTKLGTGPAIENGFYYDFLFEKPLSLDDLEKVEEKMREIIKANHPFEKAIISIDTAIEKFGSLGQLYKVELLEGLKDEGEEEVSIYHSGPFVDLCRGPHIDSTGEIPIDALKLDRVAGVYWKNDEKRDQLQRIYGLLFEDKKTLKNYLQKREEAKKRDHRVLGKELDLFSFSDMVGSGLPLWSPKGTTLRTELQNRLTQISKKYDMLPVTIPHIGKRKLYETSGHAQKFGDELITVQSHYDTFCLKPVNCPHHTQIYASRPRSYRDLPLRYMESTMQYRDEKPGEIGGLTRVRSITCDDGHIFCRIDQIEEEAKKLAKIIEEFYSSLGLFGNHWVSLSVRDPKTPDAYVGEPSDWDEAESILEKISDDLKLHAKRVEGEAAIYGPKLDYMFKDSLGRQWQLATIQIDFAMPKRFHLTYTGEEGNKETPIMIHRAILGSYERFLAILIEHYGGAFPLWLSPVQIAVLPVSEKFLDYAKEVVQKLKSNDIRTELSAQDESLGKRIREAEKQKTPLIAVVGEREVKGKTLSIRQRKDLELLSDTALSVEKIIEKIKDEL